VLTSSASLSPVPVLTLYNRIYILDLANLRLSPRGDCEGLPEELTDPACFVIGDEFVQAAEQPRVKTLIDQGFNSINAVRALLHEAGECLRRSFIGPFIASSAKKCRLLLSSVITPPLAAPESTTLILYMKRTRLINLPMTHLFSPLQVTTPPS
jgi:hypothetical protein